MFISSLKALLEKVFNDVNEKSCCNLQIGSNTLQLKVIKC